MSTFKPTQPSLPISDIDFIEIIPGKRKPATRSNPMELYALLGVIAFMAILFALAATGIIKAL